MRLPRDISGGELAQTLEVYGYHITRQTGSHLRLVSAFRGTEHYITIPKHKPLKVGTLNGLLNDVASYLELDKKTLINKLFK